MKRLKFTLLTILCLALLGATGYAGEFETVALNGQSSSLNTQSPGENPFADVLAAYQKGTFWFPHPEATLGEDHKGCLDQCSSAHQSCMSSAGDSASAVAVCDEQLWRCTLGCDNQFYSQKTVTGVL